MALHDRDVLRRVQPPKHVRAQTAQPVESDPEEDTDVGGDRETRIERRVVNTDRSTRAAFAAIKELREDFKEHSRADKEALDQIREEQGKTNAILTDLRLVVTASVTEQRAEMVLRREERELIKLQTAARGEVQRVHANAEVETAKFQREHKSRWKIQLLATCGALMAVIIAALLGRYLK